MKNDPYAIWTSERATQSDQHLVYLGDNCIQICHLGR